MTLQKIDNLKIILLYLLIGVLPFFPIFSMFIPAFGAIKEILCVLIILLSIVNFNNKISFNLLIVLFYSFIVIVSVCINNGLTLEIKANVVRYRCLYAITFALLFNSIKFTKTKLSEIGNNIFKIIFYECIIVALIGFIELNDQTIIQHIYGERLSHHRQVFLGGLSNLRLVSTLGNPINLGLQMCLATISSLYLFLVNDNKKQIYNLINHICLAMFLVIAIFTYSRTGYIAIASVFVFYCFFKMRFTRNSYFTKFLFIFILLICSFIIFYFINLYSSFSFQLQRMTFNAFFTNSRFLLTSRVFANYGLNLFNFILGNGSGCFLFEGNSVVLEIGYASLFLENGIIGLLVFFTPTIIGLKNLLKIRNKVSFESKIAVGLFCILVSFWTAMICEDLYLGLPYSLFFWLSCFMLEKFKDERFA